MSYVMVEVMLHGVEAPNQKLPTAQSVADAIKSALEDAVCVACDDIEVALIESAGFTDANTGFNSTVDRAP